MRLTSDDGHSYSQPAISPNGEFVAYVSDRSGKAELWLQQVGGGDPIQLTHDNEKVTAPAFFPDGKRILYEKFSAGQKSTIEVISTLGGEPTVLTEGVDRGGSVPSQDGRQIAYIESKQGAEHLMTISSSGGQPREIAGLGTRAKLELWPSRMDIRQSLPSLSPDRETVRNRKRLGMGVVCGFRRMEGTR